MKRLLAIGLLAGNLLTATACSNTQAPPAPAASTAGAPGTAAGDEKGAREVASRFLAPGADSVALTQALKPASADYEAVFDAASVDKVRTHYEKMWAGQKGGIAPKKGQSDVLLQAATTADFKAASQNARVFAGGWKKVAPHLKDGLTFYHFTFVEPGKTRGMSFDGLVYVNGHWVIFPKPWRALGE